MDVKTILSDLYADRAKIEKAIAALEALEGTTSATAALGRRISAPAAAVTPSVTPRRRRGRRTMSAAARKRISEAAKKRWAERKKKSPVKRTMSAAARKRISEAAKKRWAERKRAQKAG